MSKHSAEMLNPGLHVRSILKPRVARPDPADAGCRNSVVQQPKARVHAGLARADNGVSREGKFDVGKAVRRDALHPGRNRVFGGVGSGHFGARVGRITMEGRITEFALPEKSPSPINIAVGPDRNIWYTRGSKVGRVTPEGKITEFELGEGVRGSGLSAGSDRQPPVRLGNRLYVADGGGNRILWLQFEAVKSPP